MDRPAPCTAETTLLWCELAGQLETHYGEALGPHTRRVAYSWFLDRADLMRWIAVRNVGPWQARLFLQVWPRVREQMRRSFGLDREGVRHSTEQILTALEQADARLSCGAGFLAGNRLSAADLAWSALLSPVLGLSREQGFGARLPPLPMLPREAQVLIERVRSTTAGGHAVRMYARRRAGA